MRIRMPGASRSGGIVAGSEQVGLVGEQCERAELGIGECQGVLVRVTAAEEVQHLLSSKRTLLARTAASGRSPNSLCGASRVPPIG